MKLINLKKLKRYFKSLSSKIREESKLKNLSKADKELLNSLLNVEFKYTNLDQYLIAYSKYINTISYLNSKYGCQIQFVQIKFIRTKKRIELDNDSYELIHQYF